MVAALVSVARMSFCWSLEMYRPWAVCFRGREEFRSKIDIARAMIEEFDPPAGRRVCVLGDAWYFCVRLVRAIRDAVSIGCSARRGIVWCAARGDGCA